MRAAIYKRLSEETENTTSPKRQEDISRSYADIKGWTVDDAHIFEDIDVSATKSGLVRDGLTELRQAVSRGEIDVVIVWRLDRLARSVLDTLTIIKEWSDQGVAVASATEPIDLTTPIGKAMMVLIAIFAEMEADAIKARVTGSIDALRKSQRFAGGAVPYGYAPAPNPNGPGRALAVVPEEAKIIQEAADRVLTGDLVYRICQDFNDRQIPAPRSEYRRLYREGRPVEGASLGSWQTQSLLRLLTSDHLLGRQTHRGELLRGPDHLPLTVWDPILKPAVLIRLREVLATKKPRPKAKPRKARLLSGLVFCGHCGKKMYVKSSGGYALYHCAGGSNGSTCPSPRIQATNFEPYVENYVRDAVGHHAVIEEVAVVGETDPTALIEVEEAIRDTLAAMEGENADMPTLLERLSALKATRTERRESVAAPTVLYQLQPTGLTWAETYENATLAERQALLAKEVEAIRVFPAMRLTSLLDTNRFKIELKDGLRR